MRNENRRTTAAVRIALSLAWLSTCSTERRADGACSDGVRLSGLPQHLHGFDGDFVDTGFTKDGSVIYRLANAGHMELAGVFGLPGAYLAYMHCNDEWSAWAVLGNFSSCRDVVAVYGVEVKGHDARREGKKAVWVRRAWTVWAGNTNKFPYILDLKVRAVVGYPAHPDCRLRGRHGTRKTFPLQGKQHVSDETRLTLEDLGTVTDHQPNMRQQTDTCWSQGFHPKLCCQPKWGSFHVCFSEQFTFDRCCSGMVFRELPDEYIGHSIGMATPQDDFRVDILVRSFHAELPMLQLLVESVELFWPVERWRSRVLLVLDAESERDHEVCDHLPEIVECHFEVLPANIEDFNQFAGNGLSRAMWSLFYGDNYSDADYIAVVDSDTVFHTFGIADLLFDRQERPKPILFGRWNPLFLFSPLALGLEFSAEFMDSYPFTVRRDHFAELRSFISKQMGAKDFDSAYAIYVGRIAHSSQERAWWVNYRIECPSFHAIAGSILWERHRDDYFWSIRDGALLGLPPQHSCPSLHVATHMAEGGDGNIVKSGRVYLPNATFPHEYRARAISVMAAGLGLGEGQTAFREVLLSARSGTDWHAGVGKRGAWPEEAARHCKRRGLEDLWSAFTALVKPERDAALERYRLPSRPRSHSSGASSTR